jgi:hypothetical protein
VRGSKNWGALPDPRIFIGGGNPVAVINWWRLWSKSAARSEAGGAQSGRAVMCGPARFEDFPNTAQIAQKILKLCVILDLNILNNSLNGVDFKFPTEFML